MVKTNYSGLNPVVVQVLNNLQYRYSGKTPEMWCSRICYPFKKLLEYNPKYVSKNGFIQMIERSYKDGEFKAERCSFNIYCTVCDSLVIIHENTIECANKHLNECIAKTAKKRLAYSNRTPEITKLGHTYNFQQIDPFSESQKTGFLRLSRHPEVQFKQTFFCFVGLNELYKIKKCLFELDH